jgi:2-polyprenyl-3-methyl-5-hydroxy-6-metoxy-1,4-benzoquinol methylase
MSEPYDNYFEYFARMNSPTKEAFESVARSYSFWYQQYLPTDTKTRILDLGCGMGHFLYFLQKAGYVNYWGIDSSPRQVQYVKENVTSRVEVADAFDYLSTKSVFDVIVLNDVLEHIAKNKTLNFLALVYNSLGPDGLLLVKTPNMANPFSLSSRYKDFTHEGGFTEDSLRYVLSVQGFDQIQITGAYYATPTLKLRMAKLGERALHRMLQIMFKAQGYSSPNILDHLLIAVCRKH